MYYQSRQSPPIQSSSKQNVMDAVCSRTISPTRKGVGVTMYKLEYKLRQDSLRELEPRLYRNGAAPLKLHNAENSGSKLFRSVMVEAVSGGIGTERLSMPEKTDVVPSAVTTVAVKFHGWGHSSDPLSITSLPMNAVCEVKGRSIKVPFSQMSRAATAAASRYVS